MDIFGQAKMTNVWLGSREATLSDEGMKKYNQEFHHVKDGIINVDMVNSEFEYDDSIVSQRTDRILSELCENDCEQLIALTTFCRHPWFERAWVIQEVVLAAGSNVIVHWEGGCCKWSAIANISDLLNWLVLRTSSAKASCPVIAVHMLLTAKDTLEMTVTQSREPPRTKSLIGLIHYMQLYGQTRATQPEDLVYSMMGIASDGDTCGIKVDYDKHYTEVFREVALLVLKTLGARALAWSGQQKRNSNPSDCRLPSWVPDLRLPAANVIQESYQAVHPMPKLFSAAGNRKFECTVDGKSEILSLRTSYIDRVVEVSEFFGSQFWNLDAPWRVLSHFQAWLIDLERFVDAAADRHPTRYDYSTRQEMHWRIPIADRYVDEDVQKRAGLEVKDWYMATLRPDHPSSASAVSNSPRYQDSINLTCQIAFVTETGYIGIGHPEVVKGDEVHLVQGSDTPFILRKTDGRYQLIGETYVHGIMDGELVDDNTEFEWQQIH